jgi:hypothetical protein
MLRQNNSISCAGKRRRLTLSKKEFIMLRSAGLGLAALTLLLPGIAGAADEAPPAGTWKLLLPTNERRLMPLVLVRFTDDGGRWSAKVLDKSAGVSAAAVRDVRVADGLLRFTLELRSLTARLEFPLPKEKGGTLTGSIIERGNAGPAELEPTTLSSLDEFAVAKETVSRLKGGHDLVKAALLLLSQAQEKAAKPEEVRSWAARATRAAAAYGAPWHRAVVLETAEILNEQKGFESVALTYARQAERMLQDGDRPAFHKRVLDALATALTRAGKEAEAKEIRGRVAKLDFSIKAEPYAGRKGKGDRVALVELFTGVECPACPAADLAFDALGKTFKPAEVVRLEYHIHASGPDALACPDGEARVEYYARSVEGAPTVLFNGRLAVDSGGGGPEKGPDRYAEYLSALAPLLETTAAASVKDTATRKGDKIDIAVDAAAAATAGDRLRLRLVLVERQVHFPGANKIAEHQQVVRAFPGGVAGEKLTAGKPLHKTVTVDLAQVRKDIQEYLDKVAKEVPFPRKERPLALEDLSIVAFVQNDATQEVLQAVQFDVRK